MRVLDQWSTWPTAKPPGESPPPNSPQHVVTFYLMGGDSRHPRMMVEIAGRRGGLASVEDLMTPDDYRCLAEFLRRSADRVEGWSADDDRPVLKVV